MGLTINYIQSRNSLYQRQYKDLRHLVAQLEQTAIENDHDAQLKEQIQWYKAQLATLQSSFNMANIGAKIAIDMRNRSELIDSPQTEAHHNHHLINKAQNTRTFLVSSLRLMAGAEHLSRATLEIVDRSSRDMILVSEEFQIQDQVIGSSKELASEFRRREKWYAALIVLCAMLFFSACAYIIGKRIAILR